MKLLHTLLFGGIIASQLHGLEPAAVTDVAGKFASESADEQYAARMELYRLVDQASAPGKDDAAAITKTLVTVMQDPAVPDEAKKYILRSMAWVGTPEAVDLLGKLISGSNPRFKEEARQVLESIHDPSAVAVLEGALRATSDNREKIGLANSLAMQKAASSVVLLAPLTIDEDPEVALAAIQALARIGGAPSIETLKKANASSKVAAALKPAVEEALIIAGAEDPAIARTLFQSTTSDVVRTAAFIALMNSGPDGAKAEAIEQALKTSNAKLRHAALRYGIDVNLPSLQAALSQTIDQMPAEDRLVVLANIHRLKSAEIAEKIVLACIGSDDQDEKVAAIVALGRIPSQPAFQAILQALGEKAPRINQTAFTALAETTYPSAETDLLAMLKGDSSPDKVLAVKALASREVPGANQILLEILIGNDASASKEAMKILYFTATIDDLRALSTQAAATEDAAQKKSLTSLSSKIASRIDTAEAKQLVAPLK